MDLASERRDYAGERLRESATPASPFPLFEAWLQQALAHPVFDATAMALSTVDTQGLPSSRMVLLKGHDERGFVFFTRYTTQKCRDLEKNPNGSLLFHWRELDRQVRAAVRLERVPREESVAYFRSRPRSSQLAARAASGLERVASAELLEQRMAAELERWQGREVELPEDWGGYRGRASRFEFWQGQPSRLHDRLVYEEQPAGDWQKYRLAP
jgi:pyridoxamine 5'-phosphate oxidase